MKFDGNLAWKQGSAMVRANRDLVLTLAGLFFFLPSFALIMLIKQPDVPPNATPEVMMAALEPFVATMLPWAVLGSLAQTLGQLTVLGLLGGSGRATVGQALRIAGRSFLTFLVVQILTGFMIGSVLVLVMAAGSLVSPVLGVALGIYAVCLAYGRFFVASAVIVAEGQRNPFAAIMRSVALTRGNAWRIGNFLFLLIAAFFFVFLVLTVLFGIFAAVSVGEGRTAEMVTGFVSSAVTGLGIAWFMAIVAAAHRQLAAYAVQGNAS